LELNGLTILVSTDFSSPEVIKKKAKNMIPKVIHYCWFGGNPKPKLAKKCIRSWKKYCPDYEILEWNESNYDLSSAPLYVRQAYERRKWAFVTDYVRLQVVYDHGGIYLDTDVELLRSLDDLLENRAYFGFEDSRHIATGLGFGGEKGHPLLQEVMEDYYGIPFLLEDGKMDQLSCPQRNTKIFLRHGLKQDGSMQMLDEGVLILPGDHLNPKDWKTGEIRKTENTRSIHHFSASWYTPEMLKALERRKRAEKRRRLPSRIGHMLLGEKNYQALRNRIKRS